MKRLREIAKFASGAEAFHAIVHAGLLFSGATLIFLGITVTPTLNVVGTIVNALISLALGVYGWGPFGRRSTLDERPK